MKSGGEEDFTGLSVCFSHIKGIKQLQSGAHARRNHNLERDLNG